MTNNRFFLSLLLLALTASVNLLAGGLSFSLSESIRNPQDQTQPIDYQVTVSSTYNDNIDLFYQQERTNGFTDREYWIHAQRAIYRSIWLSGKRQKGIDNDLWMLDLKAVYLKNDWKTAVGFSNCLEYGKYKPKILIEQSKTFNINFFLTPFDFIIFTKAMCDTEKVYHEERIEFRFLLNIPTNLKFSKYLNTYLKLYILSKDYGFYRWQQKLMIEVNFK